MVGMKSIVTAALLIYTASSAVAECPAAPDHSLRLGELITSAQIATDERAAQAVSNRMWELWVDAPDDRAQAFLDEGVARRESYDFAGAISVFEDLIEYCPNYPEGYNQKAFAHFLRQEYDIALIELDKAIERSPNHIAAISGKALTLIGLKRDDEAQIALRKALSLNPWLKERQFLKGEMPVPKTDL